jgi:hypothetical protein
MLKVLLPFLALLAAVAQTAPTSTPAPAAAAPVRSVAPPSQVELNGFLLGQSDKVCDAQLGKPADVQEGEDHRSVRVYTLDEKLGASMTFLFPAGEARLIQAIRLEGAAGTKARPFLGLAFGDDAARIEATVGKPDKVEPAPNTENNWYRYNNRNYSLEVDSQGKLTGVQIVSFAGFSRRFPSSPPDVTDFRQHLERHDVELLIQDFMGNAQLVRGGQARSAFTKAARTDLSDHGSEIEQVLGEVQAAFHKMKAKQKLPEPQLHVGENDKPMVVLTFDKTPTLSQIAYTFEMGRWRISRIELR